jgi:hypothetical protein
VSVSIAQQKGFLRTRLAFTASNESVSPEQLIRSLAGKLFIESGPDSELARAIMDDLDGADAELYRRFESIIYVTLVEELAHRWPEADPNAATLNHSLRSALRRDTRLRVFPAGQARWVTLQKQTMRSRDLRQIGETEVLRIVLEQSPRCKYLSDMAYAVLTTAGSDSGADCVVEIESLHSAFLTARVRDLAIASEPREQDSEVSFEIERAASTAAARVIEISCERLDMWVSSGKIDTATREMYQLAVRDVVEALRTGNCDGIAVRQWLSRHKPDLTHQVYRERYRSFEYLFDSAKRQFREEMRRLLK